MAVINQIQQRAQSKLTETELEHESEFIETTETKNETSLTDEEWAEYDAELEELLNESTETEGNDGGPWFEGNPITKEEWNNHNW